MITIKKFSRKANAEMLFSVNEDGGYLWVSIDGADRKQVFDKNGCAVIVSPSNFESIASRESRKIALTVIEMKYLNEALNEFGDLD